MIGGTWIWKTSDRRSGTHAQQPRFASLRRCWIPVGCRPCRRRISGNSAPACWWLSDEAPTSGRRFTSRGRVRRWCGELSPAPPPANRLVSRQVSDRLLPPVHDRGLGSRRLNTAASLARDRSMSASVVKRRPPWLPTAGTREHQPGPRASARFQSIRPRASLDKYRTPRRTKLAPEDAAALPLRADKERQQISRASLQVLVRASALAPAQ